MEVAVLIFLSSGLFLGWSLGANDAANVFGTAVGTRMIRFGTAALICSVFVVLGAVTDGAGAAHTLGKLGAINALGGSFMAAFSAALAVYLMTKAGLPVSTTQAIVGGIIGWNLFSETQTDTSTLATILTTWVVCPMLAAAIAAPLYLGITKLVRTVKPHLLRADAYTRLGLVLAGAFGAYSLGANNIGNVMGVFVPSSPFTDINVLGLGTITSIQQLFLLGAIAIAVGVFTYSKRVMLTVGGGLLPLSPIAAWVVVVAHSIVLFLFASKGLEQLLAGAGLPTIPLVPVSSSQAVVGAVLGIGLIKGGRAIRWHVLGGIGAGWVVTPIIACGACFVGLFFLQNVFNQEVQRQVPHVLTGAVLDKLEQDGVAAEPLMDLRDVTFGSASALRSALEAQDGLTSDDLTKVVTRAEKTELVVDFEGLATLDRNWLSGEQFAALQSLIDRHFQHKWALDEALGQVSPAWRPLPNDTVNKVHNKDLEAKFEALYRAFGVRRRQ